MQVAALYMDAMNVANIKKENKKGRRPKVAFPREVILNEKKENTNVV